METLTFTNDIVIVSKAVEVAQQEFLTIPGVKTVKSEMQVTAVVTVTVPYESCRDKGLNLQVYDMEKKLYEKFPGVLFDFRMRYDFPPEVQIEQG